MKRHSIITTVFTLVVVLSTEAAYAEDPSFYVKKDTWQETMRASRETLLKEEQAHAGAVIRFCEVSSLGCHLVQVRIRGCTHLWKVPIE